MGWVGKQRRTIVLDSKLKTLCQHLISRHVNTLVGFLNVFILEETTHRNPCVDDLHILSVSYLSPVNLTHPQLCSNRKPLNFNTSNSLLEINSRPGRRGGCALLGHVKIGVKGNKMSDWLTLSCYEALKVNGDSHPHGLAVLLGPETPHADRHGLGVRLRCKASEEEGLFSKVVKLPALALICGEPVET